MARSTEPESDEAKFNETLKRMLATPPKPFTPKPAKKAKAKPKSEAKPQRSKDMRTKQGKSAQK